MSRVASLVSTIISRAYREAQITALGTTPTAAQNAEGVDNLNSFMSTALGMDLGEPLRDWLAPVPQRTAPVAANYPQDPQPMSMTDASLMGVAGSAASAPYPPDNARVVWGGVAQTLYLPEGPQNGARISLLQGSGLGDGGVNGAVLTVDGNGRYIGAPGAVPPFTATKTFVFSSTAPPSADWIYVSAYALWVPVGTLALTDSMVFPPDYDDYFILGLSGRIAPKYNKTISAESQFAFTMAQAKVKSEFAQRHDTIYGSWDFPNSLQSYSSGGWLYPTW